MKVDKDRVIQTCSQGSCPLLVGRIEIDQKLEDIPDEYFANYYSWDGVVVTGKTRRKSNFTHSYFSLTKKGWNHFKEEILKNKLNGFVVDSEDYNTRKAAIEQQVAATFERVKQWPLNHMSYWETRVNRERTKVSNKLPLIQKVLNE